MPAISIVMSVYNGEPFLSEAIESMLNQSFSDFEFIIINDGSTDESGETLKKYAQKDPRIILIQQSNHGLIFSLNKGITKAKAPLIARMDADDIALPERLQMQKSFMDQNPQIHALGGSIIMIDGSGKSLGKVTYPRHGPKLDEYIYNRGSPLAHPSVLMRRDTILILGGYRQAYKHAEDYDLWLRLHKIKGIDNLQNPILKYRQHTNKVSIIHTTQQAVASVVARQAARSEGQDPTRDLKAISRETFDIFEGDKNPMEWEVIDIISSGLLFASGEKPLQELSLQFPSRISLKSRPIAVRVFLKFAHTAAKDKAYILCVRYILKSFFTSPMATLRLLFEKSLKAIKRA